MVFTGNFPFVFVIISVLLFPIIIPSVCLLVPLCLFLFLLFRLFCLAIRVSVDAIIRNLQGMSMCQPVGSSVFLSLCGSVYLAFSLSICLLLPVCVPVYVWFSCLPLGSENLLFWKAFALTWNRGLGHPCTGKLQ